MSQHFFSPQSTIIVCLTVLLFLGSTRPASAQPHEVMLTLPKGNDNIWDLAYSPDGKQLAIANGLTVEVWDVAKRKKLFTCGELKGTVRQLSFSPDGKWISAYDSHSKQIVCIDAVTGKVRTWIDLEAGGKSRRSWTVTLAADGGRGAVGYDDGSVTVWKLPSGRTETTLNTSNSKIEALSVSADGRLLAVFANSGNRPLLMIWDVAERKSCWSIETNGTPYLAFSPDTSILATNGQLRGPNAKRIRLYDAKTGAPLAEVGKLPRRHYSYAYDPSGGNILGFSPDGSKLITGTPPKGRKDHICLDLWDLSCLKKRSQQGPAPRVSGLARLRVLGKSATVVRQDAPKPTLLTPLGSRWVNQRISTVAFNPAEPRQVTFSVNDGKDVLLTDMSSIVGYTLGRPRRMFDATFIATPSKSQKLALTQSDSSLSEDHRFLTTVDIRTGRVDNRIAFQRGYLPKSVTFVNDDKKLLTIDNLVGVRTWNVSTGQFERQQLTEVRHLIGDAVVSSNGILARYLEGRHKTTLKFWDTNAGKPLAEIETDDIYYKNEIVISPNGTLVATRYAGRADIGAIDIYSVAYQRKLYQIYLPTMYNNGTVSGKGTKCKFRFSPDGQRLFCVVWHEGYSAFEIHTNPELEKIGYLACINLKTRQVEYEVTDTNLRLRSTERFTVSSDGKALAVHRDEENSTNWIWKRDNHRCALTTIWRAASGRKLSELPTPVGFEQLEFLPNGTLIGRYQDEVQQWIPVNLPNIHYGWNVGWFEAVKFGRMLKRMGVVGKAIDVHAHLGRSGDTHKLSFALSEQVLADAEIRAALHKEVGPQLAVAGWGPKLVVNICDKNFNILKSHVVGPAEKVEPLKPTESTKRTETKLHAGARRFQIVEATAPQPVETSRRIRQIRARRRK